MSETIFAKILRGDIPCHKVYEDPAVLAFLDVFPLSLGHTLVIPREPAATMDALSDESAAALGRALPRICRAVLAATGAGAYNLLQNNGPLAQQAVMHLHVHIIPRYDTPAAAGLGLVWRPGKLDPAQGADLAQQIRAKISG